MKIVEVISVPPASRRSGQRRTALGTEAGICWILVPALVQNGMCVLPLLTAASAFAAITNQMPKDHRP
jgi:hypothetical protein